MKSSIQLSLALLSSSMPLVAGNICNRLDTGALAGQIFWGLANDN
ncbi:MAG: hypothetical protein QM487_03680 [Candidatus Marithrix sp.]